MDVLNEAFKLVDKSRLDPDYKKMAYQRLPFTLETFHKDYRLVVIEGKDPDKEFLKYVPHLIHHWEDEQWRGEM